MELYYFRPTGPSRPSLRFTAMPVDAGTILSALAGFYSGDNIEVIGPNGDTFSGVSDSPEFYTFLRSI